MDYDDERELMTCRLTLVTMVLVIMVTMAVVTMVMVIMMAMRMLLVSAVQRRLEWNACISWG